MDELFFLKQLNESPGDTAILREYACWLNDRGDPRGQHLTAELDFYDAEKQFVQAEQHLGGLRGSRPQDFEWLNSVLPMVTRAPVSGIFYSAASPDDPPFVQLGDFCSRSTVVGIIEAQKVFFRVPAGHSGIITEIYVCNATSVTAGDKLLNIIRPQKADVLQARLK